MDSKTIRHKFLNFFQANQHQIVPSAPIVVKNDPTLMFTNAGMNQFKDIFLGNQNAAFTLGGRHAAEMPSGQRQTQ
ncbi:MAG: alanine--tRNA ligase-related protein [Saprospiraceae bacterium]